MMLLVLCVAFEKNINDIVNIVVHVISSRYRLFWDNIVNFDIHSWVSQPCWYNDKSTETKQKRGRNILHINLFLLHLNRRHISIIRPPLAFHMTIVSKEVLWSVRRSYQTIWGPPLPNVSRHSGWWPNTVTPYIDRTLHQFLTITDLDLITEFDFLPNCTRSP